MRLINIFDSVYYRIYTEDGAIPSKSPAYKDDLYLARIWANQIAPPPTVMSLKRCLSAVECIHDYKTINIFTSAKSETSMDDASLVSKFYSGSTPDDPMILKFTGTECEKRDKPRPPQILLPSPKGKTPFKPHFRKFLAPFRYHQTTYTL